ncbi:hypothetical protein [Rhizobium ruizarguesonis]
MALVWIIPAFSLVLLVLVVAMHIGVIPPRSLTMFAFCGAVVIALVIASAFVLPIFEAAAL